MFNHSHLLRKFARKTGVKLSQVPLASINTDLVLDIPCNDPLKLERQLEKIKSTRATIKKFEQRNVDKFTQKELKLMTLNFDEVTSQINDGQIDIKTFEAERIKRKLSQNFNSYEYESRLRNRLENLMLEIGEDIFFPWNFNQDFKIETEREPSDLTTVYKIDNILDKDILEAKFRQLIRGMVEKDFIRIKDVSEEHMASRIKKNMQKLPEVEVECKNYESATLDFDIYKLNNIFAVDIDQNRRNNFFFDKCKIFDETVNGVQIKNLIPKKLNKDPIARFFVQFDVNLTTNLQLKLLKSGQVYKEDTKLSETGVSVHKLKLEVLIAQSNYQSLLNTDLQGEIQSFRNFIGEPDVRIIDLDGFMKGNPLLKGMM